MGDRGGIACLADETWEQPGLGWRWIGSIDVSINKAFTARAFDVSTAQLSENSQPGQQFYGIQNSNHGRIMIFAGGVPLRRNGQVVGAIGVSGGSGSQDQVVATSGASAIQD